MELMAAVIVGATTVVLMVWADHQHPKLPHEKQKAAMEMARELSHYTWLLRKPIRGTDDSEPIRTIALLENGCVRILLNRHDSTRKPLELVFRPEHQDFQAILNLRINQETVVALRFSFWLPAHDNIEPTTPAAYLMLAEKPSRPF